MTGEPVANPVDLSGRLILISGGAGALGTAIVDTLRRFGARVVVNDVTGVDGEDFLVADVADESAVESLFDRCVQRYGRMPDAVCCHAGMVAAHPIQEFPLDAFDAHMRLNVRGNFVLARAAASRWIAAGVPGHLVFTTSWVQDVPWPEIGPYNATKAAVKSLTRSFARELAPHQIRANAIAPGIVAAGMAQHQWDTQPDYRRRAAKAIPLGHLQPPQSVADAFLFLLSPLAAYMTGSTLLVDGGASLYPMD